MRTPVRFDPSTSLTAICTPVSRRFLPSDDGYALPLPRPYAAEWTDDRPCHARGNAIADPGLRSSPPVLAVGIGTVANGFFGQEWYFNADNVVDALPLALPFLVSAGVVAGQDRWPAGRTWLTAGAWLLAAAGALAVVLAGPVRVYRERCRRLS